MFGDGLLLCSGFPENVVEKSGWLKRCIRPACPPWKKTWKIWYAPRCRPAISLKRKMGLSAMMAQGLCVMFNASPFLTCWSDSGDVLRVMAASVMATLGVGLIWKKKIATTTTTKGPERAEEACSPYASVWVSLILAGDIIVARKKYGRICHIVTLCEWPQTNFQNGIRDSEREDGLVGKKSRRPIIPNPDTERWCHRNQLSLLTIRPAQHFIFSHGLEVVANVWAEMQAERKTPLFFLKKGIFFSSHWQYFIIISSASNHICQAMSSKCQTKRRRRASNNFLKFSNKRQRT